MDNREDIPYEKRSKLEDVAADFYKAAGAVEFVCGDDCKTSSRCTDTGLCISAVRNLDHSSLKLCNVLRDIERDYGWVPRIQVNHYGKEISKAVASVHKKMNGNSGPVAGYVQRITTRIETLNHLKTFF